MGYAIAVAPGERVRLATIGTRGDGGLARAEGEARLADLTAELGELQKLLAGAETHGVLVVLQGLDASGKDGAVRHAFAAVNPSGLRVVAFKAPTAPELAHDFLWRVHQHVPERGAMVVFNRSHYEDVLVPRIRDLVPEEIWRARYDQIAGFERTLVAAGTILLKFCLHIGREEQEERLLKRERDPLKAWKLDPVDWVERRSWDAYLAAYDDAIAATSAADAPWYVVPADHKWFRNLAVADAIVERLRPYRAGWLETLERRAATVLPAVRAAREEAQADQRST